MLFWCMIVKNSIKLLNKAELFPTRWANGNLRRSKRWTCEHQDKMKNTQPSRKIISRPVGQKTLDYYIFRFPFIQPHKWRLSWKVIRSLYSSQSRLQSQRIWLDNEIMIHHTLFVCSLMVHLSTAIWNEEYSTHKSWTTELRRRNHSKIQLIWWNRFSKIQLCWRNQKSKIRWRWRNCFLSNASNATGMWGIDEVNNRS